MILLDKVNADAVSAIVTTLGGFMNIIVRSGGSTDSSSDLGGGTVTIEISSPSDGLNRFRVMPNGTFTDDTTKSGIFITQGMKVRESLTGSSSPINVTVEIRGVKE